MRTKYRTFAPKSALRLAGILLFGAAVALGQQQVSLTAGAATATLPDGNKVPMWGYSCGAPVSSSTATCAALNPAANGGWSPVVITVPTGQDLQVNLTNNLPGPVPTSLVIMGQLGGGLGTQRSTTPSPVHDNQGTTWPIANSGPVFTPPKQGQRVQSFATEVTTGQMTALTWKSPRPGTYLIESGTHPSIQGPMGLYGILVVTAVPQGANAGTAYPNVNYNAELPLLMSEIDPVQNAAVNAAVNTPGFGESATYGPYEAGSVSSINLVNGGGGYTSAPTVSFSGGGGSGGTATAKIDTDSTSATYQQVIEVDIVNGGSYTTAPMVVFSGGGGSKASATAALQLQANAISHCSGGAAACYPPVVNYTPLYYLFNGVAFDKTNASNSLFPVTPASSTTGSVLVRFVNAGLRMHVPSIVGAQTGATPVGGFSLIAEDGNVLPGVPRVQSEVFLAAGKTYDVMMNMPATGPALPVFDRQLSLSGNATSRDAGMLAYIGANGATLPNAASLGGAVANPDVYKSVIAGHTLTVSDPGKGVIANDVNVYGVAVVTQPTQGALTLLPNGTFTYVANSGWAGSDSFVYQANGNPAITATVTLNAASIETGGITVNPDAFNSNISTSLKINTPGVLANDIDAAGYPLKVALSSVVAQSGLTVAADANGGFTATVPGAGTYKFAYMAVNSQGTMSGTAVCNPVNPVPGCAIVTLVFPQANGPKVQLIDGKTKTNIATTDYRWIIEEDRTFFVDPTKSTNTGTTGGTNVLTFGTNFHTSYMPVIAQGCVGQISCGSGQTVLGNAAPLQTAVDPSQVYLDPTKRYYLSVLPGDAANAFVTGNTSSACGTSGGMSTCGHGMGGAPMAYMGGQWVTPGITPQNPGSLSVIVEPNPLPPSKLTVFVYEDDFPLNGEQDAAGGVDVLAPNEPGLGGFNITISDDAGGSGDATGQVDYDMFNMPLSNSLAGTKDPATGFDACPISPQVTQNTTQGDGSQKGVTGMVVTCPKYESDGKTLSPLAGQAVIANMMPGRYGVIATPGADRTGRGEEWLQTNTLDGQKAHDSFLKVGEPAFFQEYGPASFHVAIGFANPAIINSRLKGVCNGSDINITGKNCSNTVKGMVTTERMSRTPDERLYSSGSNDSFSYTQCYVSFGDPDGEDFAFTKCASDGTFVLNGLPDGDWRVTVFDQWNDMLVDGLSTPVRLANGKTVDMGQIATNQWQSNIYTRTFFDQNGDGVSNLDSKGNPTEPGLTLVPTNIRFRDGSYSNFNNTDLNGNAGFNEVFPLFNWYVIETDDTRYKNTGTHVVYDAGGPADGTPGGGNSSIGQFLARTTEDISLPINLRVPGAVYCASADCTSHSIQAGPTTSDAPSSCTPNGSGGLNCSTILSTGRIDPPWVTSYGWQGFSGQNNFLEFGKKPFKEAQNGKPAENGGIHGHVVYASTRPFDDPQRLLQTSWEPLVPGVTINLYQEGTAPDGTTSLKLVDSTKTSSWDDWAQGFRSDGNPNMNCPGQGAATGPDADLFFFSLNNQPMYLDAYNNGGNPAHTIPSNSQFKCFDGMHNWNQLQPAPYDGRYQFPSVIARNPQNGALAGAGSINGTPGSMTGSNCTICIANPDDGTPMLPSGKYVVEVVVPPGYELVKEEDKNILIGDNFIAPVTQEFGGLASVFILPDQAQVAAEYNANNAQNSTQNLGRIQTLPSHEGDTGSIETYWPCVGDLRTVPDYISLFPGSQEVAPFAGATRNLCDRKEVTLDDQTAALAKFYIFTSTHVAAHFTGVITDDFTSEFDPFAPQFGEKFSPPDLPVSVKDWNGNEISRVYADHWGTYNGLNYSTWEVNPPNPTGYSPTMMTMCMNDPGAGTTPDPLFNPSYSQFCYELPFMPGQTQYMDTPVTPTSAFAGAGYNNVDCAYPDTTPAVKEVDGDVVGPWVNAPGGAVASVAVTNGGTGYTSTPSLTFGSAPTGGTTATGTVTIGISGSVAAVTVGNHGTGYTGTPTVTFSAPGAGTRATGTVVMSGSVASVTLGNQGSNYILGATVTFSNGGGSGAAATATVSGGKVTKITVTNGGTGYTSAPTVKINPVIFGSGATATAAIASSVASVTITNAGSGYTSAPTVSFSGGGGSGATASATLGSVVTAVNLTNPGSGYTSAPTVTFSGGGGSGAAANAVLSTGGMLTINALGDQQVPNNAYSGPSATTPPYNQKTIPRHYGFGTTQGTVTIGGKTAGIVSWGDTQIKAIVPSGVSPCAIQQQKLYGGPGNPNISTAACGQLLITAASGKQSIDSVTVNIGGKPPIAFTGTIQGTIDSAKPGDLIIVPPGVYNEILIMWKPVRLQGVGAASSVINANTHPAGKLDPWRAQVGCLFGLALNGQPRSGTNPFDTTGAQTCGSWTAFDTVHPQVDRLPLEGVLGWDTTVNGNLAQLLQEPTLMGAYEGAGITVLGKGIKLPAGVNPFSPPAFGTGNESAFPAGTLLLSASDCLVSGANPYPSNFYCNPSGIDGLSITDSSQGGGGIFAHAWTHYLQVANNRIYNNTGTLTGGITIGQGESPDAYLQGDAGNSDPGSCENSLIARKQLPYCFEYKVNVHNNAVTLNSSIGDELYSSTPAGGGGVTFCTGADYYQFNYNWVCGNLSTGDGGGLVHLGFIKNGDIEHNTILFNQSTNPTVPTNGGGILAMGAPPDGTTIGGLECGNTAADADCAPGLSDGTGPGLLINANLIMGNAAESGSGGGIRLQNVNGSEVIAFPTGYPALLPLVPTAQLWNDVTITNNIIANNVAGWDGGGISLQDALNVDIINNTVMSNDTTASAGVLFNTLGAPISSSSGSIPTNQTSSTTTSQPQPAGLVAIQNSAVLATSLNGASITCPVGHAAGALPGGSCTTVSYPRLYNDVFWQNRAFNISVAGLGLGTQNQQNVVALYNAFTNKQVASQPTTDGSTANGGGFVITGGTGACDLTNSTYWDIGVRGDQGPTDHTSTVTLTPVYSLLTAGYTSNNTSNANPTVLNQYCNGSRTPPEYQSGTWQVPPGISDATVPNPIFNLQPAATVDEGNNWINIAWGPLTMSNPVNHAALGNYAPAGGSPVVNYVPSTANGMTGAYTLAPSADFFGNPRKTDNYVDAGAVEFLPPPGVNVFPTKLTFNNVVMGTTSTPQALTLYNNTTTNLTAISAAFTGPFSRATLTQGGTGSCIATLTAGASCTINVVYNAPSTVTTSTGSAAINASLPVGNSPVGLTGSAVAAVRSATVSPNPLNFGSWLINTNSGAQTATVSNTGNTALAGGTYTLSTGFTRPAGAAGGTCGATLAVGATCTVNAVFRPTTATAYTGTLTAAFTGITPSPTASLNGTGTTTPAAVSISPSPLSITVPTGSISGTGLITLTNASPTTSTLINSVSVSGGSILTYFFNIVSGTDTCSGAGIGPGASCTVLVRFTNVLSARGPNRTGTITFNDTATGSPQTSGLIGIAQ